ncbi:uncharacterized protein LOC107417903 [Ziziphus jujuba]|uniref:Uncharacterized protein LOC107417903 n=2 Tax=Ziziphus jujuba TaxID=326968 RepID=A0A6P3ZRP0_ZIZJJ|nr:uncharacterized protein LOC107417903 [Ziziphus jujuba]XP_015882037.2 uncharacterized protein LOC107417903 [Ziziphus jujuba]KAH7528077.1 hypothetical protein FEM48_Zijuj05G0033400 [Ziziphus jujuba var. spinosa]
MMEQSRINKQPQYNSTEPGNEELQPHSQSFVRDPFSSMHMNTRPPDPNMSEVKPVLNYSIQTGEEFAFEFMRDRVNPRKPLLPDTVGDPNCAPGYLELKGMLGINHGSESGSDISMHRIAEKGPKQFERKNSSSHEGRNNHASVPSVPRSSSGFESGRGVVRGYASSGASDSSSMKIKVLCSFGGKILPRPSDGKLRYVGGETRIICIRKDISWQELMQKALSMCNQTHIIKYQLPGEDLDALVSVSCDEDLQNMMEECSDFAKGEGSKKLRMFLFSMSDLEDVQFGLGSMDGDSEVQYVVAVNGMDLASKKNSSLHGLASSLANNLDELDRQSTEKETNSAPIDSAGISSVPLTGNIVSPVTIQSSESMIPSSSSAFVIKPPIYHGKMVNSGENMQYPFHDVHVPPIPSSLVSSSIPLHVSMAQHGGSTEGQQFSGSRAENSQMPVKQVKLKSENPVPQESTPEKVFSSGKAYGVPLQPHDGNLMNYFPVENATVAVTASEGGPHLLSSKNEVKYQEPDRVASSNNSVNPLQVPKSSEDDFHSTTFAPGYGGSESIAIDLTYFEQPVIPQRVYNSERIPREQAELLNRSTKSDDSHGSQFLISHSRSDVSQQDPIAEGVDKLREDGNQALQVEQSTSTAKSLHVDTHMVDDGLARLQKYGESADSVARMKSELLQGAGSGSKHELPKTTDNKDVTTSDRTLKSEQETIFPADGLKKHVIDENSELPTVIPKASVENPEEPLSNQPVHPSSEVTGEDPSHDDTFVDTQPFPWTKKSAKHVSHDAPSTAISSSTQVDIEDRFRRDILSDIFSKAIFSDDSPGVGLLHKDGAGLSLNIENHDPKRWSYFHKLAQGGFLQKDFSLIDQDHPAFSSVLEKVEEGDIKSYHLTPFTTDGVLMDHVDSHMKVGEIDPKEFPAKTAADIIVVQSNYDQSQTKDTESIQFSAMMENLRMPELEYEDGKVESRNVGLPPLDSSLGDFDLGALELQVIKNDDLEELKELGSGTFGTVYHGKWRGTDVAIKRIKKSCFTGRSSEQERLTVEFWREADILSKLHHPNIVAFYGVVQDGPGGTLATVTEFMVDGSLRHVLLRKDRYLDRRKRLIIAMDAAFGMEYLHSKNIVHFDLKCDNLLVNLKDPLRPICKVGDFGLSKIKRNTLVSGGVRGTLPWMAPELLNGSSIKVSEKVDVFSFGIVLWEILTGEEPYANMHYGAIIGGIVNNTLRPTIPSYCDPEWRRLMEQCWAPNPAARPSFTEIASRLRVMSTLASQTKTQVQKPSK